MGRHRSLRAGGARYGYQRMAVMCRRAGHKVTNRQCYRVTKAYGLLQQRKAGAAA